MPCPLCGFGLDGDLCNWCAAFIGPGDRSYSTARSDYTYHDGRHSHYRLCEHCHLRFREEHVRTRLFKDLRR